MKIAEPYCQLLMTRRSVLTRLAAVLLGVMISVATRTGHAAAQGASSAVTDPIRDSLALELSKMTPFIPGFISATMYIRSRLGAMLPADDAQRSRIVMSAADSFDKKYAMDSAVHRSAAHTYAVRFTEQELRVLIAYERMQPEIVRAMSAVAESVVTSHRAQLHDVVRTTVGTVTGTVPAPVAPGPLFLVTARPPFLPGSLAGSQLTSAARGASPPPCPDTGKAPAAAFRGPPYGVPPSGSQGMSAVGEGLGTPTVEAQVPVAYPPFLKANGIQGTVIIRYWVNPAGCAEPASFHVKQASDSAMAAAVRDAVRRMRFVKGDSPDKLLWMEVVDQAFTFRIVP